MIIALLFLALGPATVVQQQYYNACKEQGFRTAACDFSQNLCELGKDQSVCTEKRIKSK